MLKIYLTRHGQDEDNSRNILNGRRDFPLTEKGREQARKLADEIKSLGLRFDKIYHSPLARAQETAQIISEITYSSSPEVEPRLIERDFGIMTGVSKRDVDDFCKDNECVYSGLIKYFLAPDGAETFPELMVRAKELLSIIEKQVGNVLLVTHGDTGKMIYSAYYNIDWKDCLTQFHFGNCDLILLDKDLATDDRFVIQTTQYNS